MDAQANEQTKGNQTPHTLKLFTGCFERIKMSTSYFMMGLHQVAILYVTQCFSLFQTACIERFPLSSWYLGMCTGSSKNSVLLKGRIPYFPVLLLYPVTNPSFISRNCRVSRTVSPIWNKNTIEMKLNVFHCAWKQKSYLSKKELKCE